MERSAPAKPGSDRGSERGGERTTDLIGHVHKTGNRSGRPGRDIGRYRPKGTLGETEGPRPAREDDAGKARTLHLRTEDKKNGGQQQRKNRDAAASGAFAPS